MGVGAPPPQTVPSGSPRGAADSAVGRARVAGERSEPGCVGCRGWGQGEGVGGFFLRRRFLGEIEERRMFHPRRSGPPFSRLACSLRSDDRLGGDGREGPRAAEAQGAGLQSFSCAVTSHAGRRVPRVVIALVSRVRSSSRVTKISQR